MKIKKMIFYLFTFTMVFTLAGCKKKQAGKDTMNQETQTSPAKEIKQPEESPKKSKQQEINAVNIKNMVHLKGELKIEKNVLPDIDNMLSVYDITPIVLDESILDFLEKKGWTPHKFTVNDKGKYVITSKVKDQNVKKTLNKEKSLAQAKMFLEDSGIDEILKKQEITYQTGVEDTGGICIVYNYLEDEKGNKTDAYIRMIFEKEKSCEECVINLYQSRQIESLPTISFKEAIKNAFYIENDMDATDKNDYRISKVEVQYVEGIPYYKFMAYGIGIRRAVEGFAIAVDITKSQFFETILEQYKDFSIQ